MAQLNARMRRTVFQAKTLAMRPAELPEINLAHLRLLTDHTGIIQHSEFSIPRYEGGYCLDDNARALLLMALVEDGEAKDVGEIRELASRHLAFVRYAFNTDRGCFRNFMSYGRHWLEERGSEDSHGRAVWALGSVVGRSGDPGRQSLAGDLFQAALPAMLAFTSPRAWAFGLLGIDEYVRAFGGDSKVQAVQATLARRLFGLLQQTRRPDWPWFENRLTYSNARLPQALFDQQPVEACGTIASCLEAERQTANADWRDHARRAFDWFLGQNVSQVPLYDPTTGGCRDGLHVDRANENQGAESTLSFLLSLSEMRLADRTSAVSSATAGSTT